jgi:uncharacterized protein
VLTRGVVLYTLRRRVPKPLPLAVAWVCFEIALTGCASALTGRQIATTFDAGVAAYDAGHFDQAYAFWASIDGEDVAAMRNVGILLRKGQGVKKNPRAAEKMFERAAETGLVTAKADLADMLLKGEAGPPDPKRALPLLESAAAANHPIAQFELAQMYETGGLVPRNIDVARRLYAAANSHGLKEAGDRLATLGPVAQIPSVAPVLRPSEASAPGGSLAASPAAPPDSATATSGAYTLQVGAYKNRIDADVAWKAYQAKYAALLLRYSSNVQRVDLGDKGTWYRLRISGFGNREAASALCDQLKSQGDDCFFPNSGMVTAISNH